MYSKFSKACEKHFYHFSNDLGGQRAYQVSYCLYCQEVTVWYYHRGIKYYYITSMGIIIQTVPEANE